MHPVDKKSALYIGFLLILVSPVIVFFWLKSIIFIFLTVIILLLIDRSIRELTHSFLLTIILSTYIFIVFFIIKQILVLNTEWNFFLLIITLTVSIIIPALSYIHIYTFYLRIADAAKNEKNNYFAVKRFPYLICEKHFTKTVLVRRLGYKEIRCRKGKLCFARKKLVYAKQIIGVIGKDEMISTQIGDYYISLWNENDQAVKDADYDAVEIIENNTIKDYNAIINKVVNFLYNEIDRYKPINEVVVRVFGNPDISESTKRLLNKRFKKVEYIIEK